MDESIQSAIASDPLVMKTARSEADARAPKSALSSPARVAGWSLTLAIGLAALVGVAMMTIDRLQTDLLLSAGDAEARETLGEVWPTGASGEYYEALGELVEVLEPENREMAQLAAERAVAADPTRAFAWARLAYFSLDEVGMATEDTLVALRASMEQCPLCDQALVRWRFNFVLSHWSQMPEIIRKLAFTHADVLRWSGNNSEFLAEMRVKANAAGIPYDAYRAAVDTPVRSWDIELSE